MQPGLNVRKITRDLMLPRGRTSTWRAPVDGDPRGV